MSNNLNKFPLYNLNRSIEILLRERLNGLIKKKKTIFTYFITTYLCEKFEMEKKFGNIYLRRYINKILTKN